MRRFRNIIILLFIMAPAGLMAQSKFSYSLLVNESASADDEYSVCLLRTTGGECVSLERNWKINITAAANYWLNDRVRLQSGLSYNVLSLDKVNEALDRDAFKIRYLSIPIRSHFFITKGKVSFYTGAGIRTDIRLNDAPSQDLDLGIRDNGRAIALSAEVLLGLEIKVSPQLAINFEPTFSRGITSYDRDPDITALNNSFFSIPMMVEHPQRLGITLGVTYSLTGSGSTK